MINHGRARLRLLAAVSVLVVILAGCGSSSTYPTVRLTDLEPLPPRTARLDQDSPLRVAIASVLSPRGNIESYGPFLSYLSERLGRRVELIQRQTYAETNELIGRSSVDMAFVCSGAYVEGKQSKGMELLVVPQVNGETVYYSLIIVPADSAVHSLTELRGKVFAFTDPLSNSGYLAVVYHLWQLGEQPETFFARTIYTYSHDNSIKAVADKLVGGAGVDSLVYSFVLEREPYLGAKIRVVYTSPPYGIPPVVVPTSLDPETKAQLREILLTMHEDGRGRQALADIKVDRFVPADESLYDSVRQMLEVVGTP